MPDLRIYNEKNRDAWPEGYAYCDITMCGMAGPLRSIQREGLHICEYHWHKLHAKAQHDYSVVDGKLVIKRHKEGV